MSLENTWPPSPPAGYEMSQEVPETSPFRVRAGILCGIFGAIVVVIVIAWVRRHHLIVESPAVSIGLVPLILAGIVAHEAIHACVSWWAGCRTLFRIEWDGINSAPAVLPYGAFQTRRETILFYLAPLGILCTVSFPILVYGTGVLATAALVVLVTSLVESMGDLHDVWFVVQLPRRALEHHDETGRIQYYVPIDH